MQIDPEHEPSNVSVVIIARNEEANLKRCLPAVIFSDDILVVDDGSDDETVHIAQNVSVPDSVKLDVIETPGHRGKGHAVKTGILRAKGNIVLFVDSGSCVSYDEILSGIDLIRSGRGDIAHGSRHLPESQILNPQNLSRRISSALFRWFVRFYLDVPSHLTDTQCGLKLYRGDVAHKLYKACATEGFMFDVEVIYRAQQAGYQILEFPIHWYSDPDSRLSLSKAVFSVIKELRRIKSYN